MNVRIYRYRLDITDRPSVRMPSGARVLSVGPPRDGSAQLDVWALVDADPDTLRDFHVVGTGNPVPNDCGPFVGTVATHGGFYMWHVFEATR